MTKELPLEAQLDLLRRGTTEIISEQDLAEKLKLGRPLRVKLGVDPTAAHVTLGWAVVLRKLRDFQRLGHTACLVIGDFTAQIGDPSGKSKTRPPVAREEVKRNVDAVGSQIYKILDPSRTEVTFNRDWLGAMDFEEVIRLAARTTVARILARDDFAKRLAEERPIALHEILYPLCQAYDSVELRADVELGGSDQKFNILMGRTLMQQYGQAPQVVLLCPLLIGTDGQEKMSQSKGNYVSIMDHANDMYGKTMSIPDDLLENWFELCTDVPMDKARAEIAGNPYAAKKRLAREIVALYHSADSALEADDYFARTFSDRKQPVEAEEASIPAEAIEGGEVQLPALLVALRLAKSKSSARGLLAAGAVSLDGDKLTGLTLAETEARGRVLRVGKHQFRKLV